LYCTERAIFRLIKNGIELIEIAPGIDLDRDVLSMMEFRPKINKDLKTMDAAIFSDSLLNLKNKK
jgi:propionate CoA-transferase